MAGMLNGGARLVLVLIIAAILGTATSGSAQAQACVRWARALSDVDIRGDAWTWWASASGQYARSQRPAPGSVLVFRRTNRLDRGHVSTVSRIVDSRTIEVDHSWLSDRRLYRGMRVIDVSADNSWSAVRVWHPKMNVMGTSVFPTFGFVHPPSGSGGRDSRDTVVRPVLRDQDPGFRPRPVLPSTRSAAVRPVNRPARPETARVERAPSAQLAQADGDDAIGAPVRRPAAALVSTAKPVQPRNAAGRTARDGEARVGEARDDTGRDAGQRAQASLATGASDRAGDRTLAAFRPVKRPQSASDQGAGSPVAVLPPPAPRPGVRPAQIAERPVDAVRSPRD